MNAQAVFFGLLLIFAALPFGKPIETEAGAFEDDDLLWDRAASGEAEPQPVTPRFCSHATGITELGHHPITFTTGATSTQGCSPAAFNAWFRYFVPAASKQTFTVNVPTGVNVSLTTSCRVKATTCYNTIANYDTQFQFKGEQYAGQFLYFNFGSLSGAATHFNISQIVTVTYNTQVLTLPIDATSVSADQIKHIVAKLLGLTGDDINRIIILSGASKRTTTSSVDVAISPSADPNAPNPIDLANQLASNIGTNTSALSPLSMPSGTPLPLVPSIQSVTTNISTNSYISANPRCLSDAECSNHGKCVNFGCSCYSGFGIGATTTCTEAPADPAVCPFASVAAGSSSFNPSYTLNLNAGNLELIITSPIQQTKFASFGPDVDVNTTTAYSLGTFIHWSLVASESQCNFPSTVSTSASFWTKLPSVAGACNDTWTLNVPWAQARSQCGFAYDSVEKVWKSEVTMQRTYGIPFEDLSSRSTLGRVESLTFNLIVNFPETVVVDSNITVIAPKAVHTSAIVNVMYVPAVSKWRIDVQTRTAAPYHLSLTSASFPSRTVSDSSMSDIDTCNSLTSSCDQLISIYIDGCDGLVNALAIVATPVCNVIGVNCLNISQGVNITATLATQSSCNATKQVALSHKLLNSYPNASMLATASTFKAVDTAYFAAQIDSSEATISNKTVTAVCLSMDGSQSCTDVTFVAIASADPTKSPAFSVYLGQTRQLTSDMDTHAFTVRATIALQWTDATHSRRSETREVVSSAQTMIRVYADEQSFIEDTVQQGPPGASENSSSDTWKNATIGLAAVMGAALVGLVVVGALVLRRKSTTQRNNA